ncbi:MAG: hypothetical protein BJ554DRAFT_5246 [Olpidium bornovanus]|uniref:Uncharacterized protein n=1 Tax=Olpidium bornovanus TaxID=278681 RepID=A0A8H8A033_9FUNG|nr:MAG: hypothetical protein BJ554DRAFT_5246 [Olpidium bornovanus]
MADDADFASAVDGTLSGRGVRAASFGIDSSDNGAGGAVTVTSRTSGCDEEDDDHVRMFTPRGENSVLREFIELLSAEVAIDLDKLRDAARHGIPDEVRRVSVLADTALRWPLSPEARRKRRFRRCGSIFSECGQQIDVCVLGGFDSSVSGRIPSSN